VATRPRLVLASTSPRRAALLGQAGIVPDAIIAPDVDEEVRRNELPREYALRMARDKAIGVASSHTDALILAADTIVARGRRILPKAATDDEVRLCLDLLSGRRHRVFTALAVMVPGESTRANTHGSPHTRIVMTHVAFKRLSADDISRYLAAGEGLGKAGGYAIQGLADSFVRRINGSYSNIVGLPLLQTVSLLNSAGYALS
jgi:septum formation protein